jgi:hypothetical protein
MPEAIPSLDPQLKATITGDAPLETILARFPTRGDMLRFYAQTLEATYLTETTVCCGLCQSRVNVDGAFTMTWDCIVRLYWIRIIAFSSVFLPVFMFTHLLGISIHPHLKIRFGETITFRTRHPVCRACRANHRYQTILAVLVSFLFSFTLAISFLVAAISGSWALACVFHWWGFKLREASDPAWVFLASSVICFASILLNKRVAAPLAMPASLRKLVKKPFRLIGLEYLPSAA